jgi:hypothetical protein
MIRSRGIEETGLHNCESPRVDKIVLQEKKIWCLGFYSFVCFNIGGGGKMDWVERNGKPGSERKECRNKGRGRVKRGIGVTWQGIVAGIRK